MPAVIPLLKLLKNPTVLKWGAIITLIVSLFIWGYHSSNQVESYKKDILLEEQKVVDLESALKAEKDKARQRELDAIKKQGLIDGLSEEKNKLYSEYKSLKDELDDLTENVIPNIKTDADLNEAKQVVEQAVNMSFGCIEAATKGESCEN